jgi:ribonuclease HI
MGQFVLSGSSWINGKCSTNEGKAMTILVAMKELQQRGYTNVIFETDSQNEVDAIHHIRSCVSEFSSIICKIRCMLSTGNDFKVKYIKQQSNMIAHTFARAAIFWPSRTIFELIPLCFELFFLVDIKPLLCNKII